MTITKEIAASWIDADLGPVDLWREFKTNPRSRFRHDGLWWLAMAGGGCAMACDPFAAAAAVTEQKSRIALGMRLARHADHIARATVAKVRTDREAARKHRKLLADESRIPKRCPRCLMYGHPPEKCELERAKPMSEDNR